MTDSTSNDKLFRWKMRTRPIGTAHPLIVTQLTVTSKDENGEPTYKVINGYRENPVIGVLAK